ncbi:hypothetical protein [Aliterella atlantica]|nr:hypothetical protein [Aliterella atlantica]
MNGNSSSQVYQRADTLNDEVLLLMMWGTRGQGRQGGQEECRDVALLRLG